MHSHIIRNLQYCWCAYRHCLYQFNLASLPEVLIFIKLVLRPFSMTVCINISLTSTLEYSVTMKCSHMHSVYQDCDFSDNDTGILQFSHLPQFSGEADDAYSCGSQETIEVQCFQNKSGVKASQLSYQQGLFLYIRLFCQHIGSCHKDRDSC